MAKSIIYNKKIIILAKYYFQTRPDQTRPDQTRPDHKIISIDYLCYYNNLKYKKIQPMLQLKIAS